MLPDRHALEAEWLLLRCQRGEAAALEQLVQQWEWRLLYYVRRIVADEQDAWDVVQQVWVSVLRRISSLRDPSKLAPWLYRIARNAAYNHRKSRAVREQWIDEAALLEEVAEDETHFSAADAEAIHAGLARLSLPHREVLTLFFLQDLTLHQIAQVLHVPPGTIKSRLHYAKSALRKVLIAQEA